MRFLLAGMVFACLATAGVNPGLTQVQSVYILPMGSAMDQFLANRLTRFGRIQVVTDPQNADAILTDRIGEGFEKKLDELYGKPGAAAESDEDEDTAKNTAKDSGKLGQAQAQAVRPSFGRGKGTFFLVNRKTRTVIWSVYELPRNTSARELDHAAGRVVDRLKHDLNPSAN